MKIIESTSELVTWRKSLPPPNTVGFVPTMGALHHGHATLLRHGRSHCDVLVLSVFVNPAQFGPHEDFNKYPRPFEEDLAVARTENVDVVFHPKASDLYPTGYSTYVEETIASQGLCGAFRPGHFRGVTTIVLKFFNLIQPHKAWFGLKDAQQFFIIKKMVEDLNLDIEVQGVPTVREPDGLALSSRNRYLSAAERELAPLLYTTLRECVNRGLSVSDAHARLTAAGFRVEYLEWRRLPTLTPCDPHTTPRLLAAAAYLGTTRLIDNVMVGA